MLSFTENSSHNPRSGRRFWFLNLYILLKSLKQASDYRSFGDMIDVTCSKFRDTFPEVFYRLIPIGLTPELLLLRLATTTRFLPLSFA
jgi:hypothetical protein